MTSLSTSTNASTQTLVFSTDPDPLRVLAISPPFLLNAKKLPDNVAGANRNMVYSDRLGLLFYIFPYINMSATDQINVYLGTRTTPVASFGIGLYTDQLVPFYLPPTVLEQLYATPAPLPASLPLHYTVQRISGNDESSPTLPLLYKPFGPGEHDHKHHLPHHQCLAPPMPSETVIDQTVINKGMFVTVPAYAFQAAGDTVGLSVGPLVMEKTVTVAGDLLFELMPAFLRRLPNTDQVSINYEIVDIVQNMSGWSTAVVLALKPNTVLLTAPIVDEADANDNVNYDALAGADATVILTGIFTARDVVVLTVVMHTLAGDRVERKITVDVKAGRSLRVLLENGFVRNAIRGSMILSYTQQSAGVTRPSKSYTFSINGLALPAAAPAIDEQMGTTLPAETSLAHVRVPTYWPLQVGATVQLFWQVTGANGVVHLFIFAQVINDVTQEIIFVVEGQYIERFAGSPLTVLYKIENPGRPVVQSESLQIRVGKNTVLQPTITSITDATTGAPITDGSTTISRKVILEGTAQGSTEVDIRDAGNTLQTVPVKSSGTWSFPTGTLAPGLHIMTAKVKTGAIPESDPRRFTVKPEWIDLDAPFQSDYGGWIPHDAARGGSIRNWNGVVAFYNFTDTGPADRASGAIFYRDIEFPPGQYLCTMEATHIKEFPNPGLRNPLLSIEDSVGSPYVLREVPKDGVWYRFVLPFTVSQKQIRRLYLTNHQNITNGNDFGIRNVRVTQVQVGRMMTSVPQEQEAPEYKGAISKLVLPT